MLPICRRTSGFIERHFVLGLLLEPAEVVGAVWWILRWHQRRSQPVNLLVAVVVGSDRAVASGFLDQGRFLDDAHDGTLRRRLVDAVGAAVADHQEGLLGHVFGSVVVEVHVVDKSQGAGFSNRGHPNLQQKW